MQRTRHILIGLSALLILTGSLSLGHVTRVHADRNADPYGVISQVIQASDDLGASESAMIRVVNCEEPDLVRLPRGSHGEVGPFQWMESTFDAIAPEPWRSMGVWNISANIYAGVWAHLHGYSSQWSCG